MSAWDHLDDAVRFQIALAVARRRGAEFCGVGNVVSVGAGFRLRGQGHNLVPEVCLRFMVKRKWSDKRARPSKIPPVIRAYPLLDGRRRLVLIPTDVSEFSAGEPHAAVNLTAGITSRQGGVGLEYGAVCGLVRNVLQPSQRYLLSCYHVFSPRLLQPPPPELDCITSANDVRIGDVFSAAQAEGVNGLDAALVLVDDAAMDSVSVWGRSIRSRATDFDVSVMHERGPFYVLGRQTAPQVGSLPTVTRDDALPVQFAGFFPRTLPFDYRATAGRTYDFAGTIQYVGDVRPVDSGSALIDGAGMLYGMHFYGEGTLGYALAAPRLFDPDVFSLNITL